MFDPIYHVENLIHRYNRRVVLAINRLAIQPASIVGLVGPNGSGKSTLLKLLAFIIKPTEGTILFDGRPALPFDDRVRFCVTLLTQEPYLMKRTVFNNIAYGLKVRGESGDWNESVHAALEMVGLDPDDFSGRMWNELSGGEAQRVALAARLVLKPQVLLLDEPTASVDAASSELIRTASLQARSDWGASLVIASHDRQWLYDVCDDVHHLFKGVPVGNGRSNMVFGPWSSDANGQWFKRIGENLRLIVPAPPFPDATAFIDPADITVTARGEDPLLADVATVDGTLTRLSLDQNSNNLFADVRIGTLSLVARVSESHLAAMTLHRGWPVSIRYRKGAIRWW
ncbi:MAG: tungsten ABC transporter ATP-binding protein [Proteobacteria bacterium]|nr:MAG: tungsten ABC transporter ATP-binding protein [Pseudomonadota bacterium]PIE66753.1 MAG: tungsten ABC transporter ATP-binding protein [Deltaproteobacteria bacterium]